MTEGAASSRALTAVLTSATSLLDALKAILDEVRRVEGVARAGICLSFSEARTLHLAVQFGLTLPSGPCTCRLDAEPLLARIWSDGASFRDRRPEGGGEPGHCLLLGPEGGAAIPFSHDERRVAVLLAGTACVGGFSARARAALLSIADEAAPLLARIRAEHERGASEELYQSVIRQSSDGIFVLDPVSHRVLEANERLREMTGYSEDELCRLTLEELSASSAESIAGNVEKVLSLHRHYVGERKYRRKDGKLIDVEISASRVRYGPADAVLANVRDISQRKIAEETLASVRHRHQLILDSAGEGILGLDRLGRHTFVNPAAAELLGYKPEELIGWVSHPLWHHTRRDGSPYPPAQCPIYASIHDGKVHRVTEDLFWRRDGSTFLVDFTSTPILEGSEVAGAVVVFRDISKVARLESIAEAIETMNSIGYVFSAVRHELGNPVNSVKMALSVLRNNLGKFPEETVRTYLDRSLEELLRVEDLLVSLKSFSLYENVKTQEIDLIAFLEQFLALVRPDFERRGISLRLKPSPDARKAVADPRALQQVLLNLFANAADALAGRSNPRIVLRTFAEPGLSGIRVEDNGTGIPDEVRRELFQPFRTTKASGTGLGLVVVKKMMAKMEGTIDVETWPGSGTTMILTLQAEAEQGRS